MPEPPFDSVKAARELAEQDPRLGEWIERIGPIEVPLKPLRSPFRYLTEAITYQQLHGKAAATIFGRFRDLYGTRGFPSPEELLATPEEELRAAGLSGSKIAAIRDLALKVGDGTVPTAARLRKMSDDEIVKSLTAVRGIGPWTAQMLLIFALGRPDVLAATDYGVQSGFRIVFGLDEHPAPKEIIEHGERWRPWRTAASLYLWRAVDTGEE